MKKFLPILFIIIVACGKEFEPNLSGLRAYQVPARPQIQLLIGEQEKTIKLPGEVSAYRFAQWTKSSNEILLTQIIKTERCSDYQIISIDTTGIVTDTLYIAQANTPVNFKLAPNDSLLLLKTYRDDCEHENDQFNYTFYNRYSKKTLPDTIAVGNAWNIPLRETVWSPDSKNVIIQEWSGGTVKAFTYNLERKDTTFIDRGSNFIWSPVDNDVVAYVKDFSVYARNIKTGEKEILFEGKSKRGAGEFRFNPSGEFLMIHLNSYLLNMEAAPFQRHTIIYYSIKDKTESRRFYEDQRIDTWKEVDNK